MLRDFVLRRGWGPSPLGVQTLKDRTFLIAIGVRLAVLNEESSFDLFPEYEVPVSQVIAFVVSEDRRYLAVSVNLKRSEENQSNLNAATLLVYDADAYLFPSKRPKSISHLDPENPLAQQFVFLNFYEDSNLIAAKVSRHILVYEWRTSEIKYKVNEPGERLRGLGFYPGDWNKLVGVGGDRFLTVWRFSRNKIHAAPIATPPLASCTFTCFVWINDDLMLTGSDSGFLCVYSMKSCEFRFKMKVFEAEEEIVSLLSRSEVCVVAGRSGILSVLTVLISNTKEVTMKLTPVGIYTLPQEIIYYNLQWCYLTNYLSHEVIISCSSCLSVFDLEITRLRHEVMDVSISDNGSSIGSRTQSPGGIERRGSFINRKKSNEFGIPSELSTTSMKRALQPKSVLLSHHARAISGLATSRRLSHLVSHSSDDKLVRIWQYKASRGEVLVDHSYAQAGKLDVPLCLDSHPSGRLLAFGCENDVQEVSVTDNGLVCVRRYPTRVSVADPHGQPFANSSPVGIVVYSNGGHMLAVAAGKSVQVFMVHNFDYTADIAGKENLVLPKILSNVRDPEKVCRLHCSR